MQALQIFGRVPPFRIWKKDMQDYAFSTAENYLRANTAQAHVFDNGSHKLIGPVCTPSFVSKRFKCYSWKWITISRCAWQWLDWHCMLCNICGTYLDMQYCSTSCSYQVKLLIQEMKLGTRFLHKQKGSGKKYFDAYGLQDVLLV